MQTQTMNKQFWNVKTSGKKSNIDLFGFVGGSKEWEDGFNEEDFLKEIREIPAENELYITVNSFGGSVYTALSIYTLLKEHKGAITFRIDGAAMSAATIITSVPNAKVIMPKGSMMMIHKVSSIAFGNVDDFRKAADDMEKLENNLLDIYAEKTGKDIEEIREKVNAETFFTASEAVDFGLADEIDETKVIENKASGNVYSMNGLEANAERYSYLSRMPKGFFHTDAETETPSAFNSNPLKETVKEAEKMDMEKLKAEYPELVEEIRKEAMNEGAQNERKRIQGIEEIAVAGFEAMVQDAKFVSAMTPEQVAMAICKDRKGKAKNLANAREEDAAELANIAPAGNEGLNANAEQKAKEDAEWQALVEAGRKAYNGVK